MEHTISPYVYPGMVKDINMSYLRVREIVSEHLHVPMEKIKTTKNNREASFARMIIAYICFNKLKMKKREISRMLNEHHSTTIKNLKSLSGWIDTEESTRNIIRDIERKVLFQ